MAQHSLLVRSYLASARSASPDSHAGRLAWLEERRSALSAELEGGDWEVHGSSFDGATSSARRGATAAQRLEAVMEAIEISQADPDATRPRSGGMLIPRFGGIPHS